MRTLSSLSPPVSLFSLSLFSLSHLYFFLSLSLFVSFISSSLLLASVWRVLCCAVLLYVVVLCVCACLCVSLCHVSGVEQCVQVKRINGGFGNVLFSTYSQTENR